MIRRKDVLIIATVFVGVGIFYLSQMGSWLAPLQSEFIVYGQAGTGGGSISGASGPTGSTSSSGSVVIPFLIASGSYPSLITITNLGTTTATISGKFYTDLGAPGAATFTQAGPAGSPGPASFKDTLSPTALAPNQTLYFRLGNDGTGTGREWGQISFGPSNISVNFFLLSPNGTLYGERVTTTGNTQQAAFAVLASSPSYPNFILVVNPSPTDTATITLNLLDLSGNPVASNKQAKVLPGNLTLLPVDGTFGGVPITGVATATLQSDKPVAVKIITLSPNGTVTTLPVLQP
jgi:hypothetical protein